jgi:cellobiose phosphorylase
MSRISEQLISLSAGKLKFDFLPTGDLFQAKFNEVMINQWLSNPIDGSMNNIYLRFHDGAGINAYPLLGIQSQSEVFKTDQGIIYRGQINEVQYEVTFTLHAAGIWFWDVQLQGSNVNVDVIYTQDIGVADVGAVRSNEAYLSQYIDHTVLHDENWGYVVCSRQNQPQGGKFPYIQQGSLTKSMGYSTDGFQFFGLNYKETNEPIALSTEHLANEVYQYEMAYTALQSQKIQLNGEAQFLFYGLVKEDHPTAITALEFRDEIKQAYAADLPTQGQQAESIASITRNEKIGKPIYAEALTRAEIDTLFPERYQEEWDGEDLLAFFTPTYEHVVLKQKELKVERPHGHILMSGNQVHLGTPVITTSAYMYGIFNSQLVVGNTNFNKMSSNARNALNVPKTSGQRIYVEQEGSYHLLTMPSLFEIGFNYARWVYKMQDDTIIITNYAAVDAPELTLHVTSTAGKAYRYLVTDQITMNVNEYELPYQIKQDGNRITYRADESSLSRQAYPDLEYRLTVSGTDMSLADENLFVTGVQAGSASLTVLELEASEDWTLKVQGLLHGEELPTTNNTVEEVMAAYRDSFAQIMNGFNLSLEGHQEQVFKVNALAWWYTHNMLVHYAVPHGLEQYGGAAWGTRDVCQGPVEYFMATHQYKQVRDILLKVFEHQFLEDGNWPQWFMFDEYASIQQEESHGDIIVWPLKVLGDYLNMTQDYSILEEKVPYTTKHGFTFTEESYSILEHAQKEIEYIKNHFLHDTHLSAYGDGDWDDTLQPANAQLKQYMVSSWTVSLTYQTLLQFSKVIEAVDTKYAEAIGEMAAGVKADFNKYMLGSEVIPGFLYMEQPDQPKFMLHPQDTETGIQYRLLPMTRSMISELLSPEQAEAHYHIIREHLFCPDGVRLMNRPAHYAGGVSNHFKRAEQAANFGREVGLQYVHAHIRFVEAMAKLGKVDEVWSGLERINPVGIQDIVPNAELRQSNTYFSSSDGKFNTRYTAEEQFDKLRTGDVAVKGGWRIYSSGPGIYMNQLISNALGIRQQGGDLIIDPVLPSELNGLNFKFEYAGKPITCVYHLGQEQNKKGQVVINGHKVHSQAVDNVYRQGGVRIASQDFERVSNEQSNTVEIYM